MAVGTAVGGFLTANAGAIAATSLVASTFQASKAASAQRKSERFGRRKAGVQAASERREQVRQARIRRAEVLSSSANTGGTGSSSEAGAISGVQNQLGQRLGSSLQIQSLSNQQSDQNIAANQAQNASGMFASIGNFSSNFITPKAP
jgi:hypothetical protein